MARRLRTSTVSNMATYALLLLVAPLCVNAASGQQPLGARLPTYKQGEAIPVTCLNRTIDNGEHRQYMVLVVGGGSGTVAALRARDMMDAQGRLQYIDFPVCNETGRPLEFSFGVEQEISCTLEFIDDPFFHLLEFYVHNDVPLTCRIPTRPLPSPLTASSLASDDQIGVLGSESTAYTPLIVALTGTLQKSHLHVSSQLNVLLHAGNVANSGPGSIDAATAYSVARGAQHANTRIVIGDSLPLKMSVRWYPGTQLPSGWSGVGGHVYLSTLMYCLASAGTAAALCIAWYRGFVLPRRLKAYAVQRLGAGLPVTENGGSVGQRFGGGYGYGLPTSGGYGFSGGKRD